jgi:hypothetical protein
MNPRRHPRTMQEAFGPYTTRDLHDKPTPMHRADKIVLRASIVAAVALFVILSIWG